jgi:pyridoxamine 5'-phosphate oxidase
MTTLPPTPTAEDYQRDEWAIRRDNAMFAEDDPFRLFGAWFDEARALEVNDANAMTLATVAPDGTPDARIVLLKGLEARGFVFFSNLQSAKGTQLLAAPQAALVFHWKSLRRQVRVRGAVEAVPMADADAYFASRARESRVGAWASDQSRPLSDRETLVARAAEFESRFEGVDVPRPPHWAGFCLVPLAIEFWADRPFRLHDRRLFERASPQEAWRSGRLYP